MRRVLLISFVLGLIAIAGAGVYVWRDLHTAVVPPAGGALVSVRVGAPFRSIAEQLHGAGVLRHPFFLTAWARYQHLDRRVQSGAYRVAHPVTPLQLLELLQSPSLALHWVTIPEGYTALQVAVALEQAGFGGRDVFRCTMEDAAFLRDLDLPATGVEGFLFPDTYALAWAIEPETEIRTMVA